VPAGAACWPLPVPSGLSVKWSSGPRSCSSCWSSRRPERSSRSPHIAAVIGRRRPELDYRYTCDPGCRVHLVLRCASASPTRAAVFMTCLDALFRKRMPAGDCRCCYPSTATRGTRIRAGSSRRLQGSRPVAGGQLGGWPASLWTSTAILWTRPTCSTSTGHPIAYDLWEALVRHSTGRRNLACRTTGSGKAAACAHRSTYSAPVTLVAFSSGPIRIGRQLGLAAAPSPTGGT